MQLRARFEVNAPDTLFLPDADQDKLQMNCMPRFVEHSWDAIKNQRELNVQDTRVMVLKSICKETMEEAFKLVEPKL